MFRRTVQSTEMLRKIGTQMSAQITEWIGRLDTEISVQEIDQTLLSSLIPSTTVFIEGWKAVQKAAAAFSSILKNHTSSINARINSVLDQLYDAETLRDEMAHTLTGLSTMIETSQGITTKCRGILHPLRRLPPEILLQIFEECVEDEADELRRAIFIAPGLPRMPIALSAVCRPWRRTVLHSPRLWSYIRLPIDILGNYEYIGNAHTANFLTRAQGAAIELTVPGRISTVEEAELTNMNIRRLNIANVGVIWPPPSSIPSPAHLWLGYSGGSSGISYIACTIPPALVSRTTRITCSSVHIEFEAPARSVVNLLLEGRFPMLALTSLLGNLPDLKSLDMVNLVLHSAPSPTIQHLRHSQLASLAIHASALATLEQSLSEGLKLPSIRHFSLSGLTNSSHVNISLTTIDPSRFPLTTSQLSTTVTELGFTEATWRTCIRSWIDAFAHVDTVSSRGKGVKDVLCALYWIHPRPRGASRSMPKGVKTLIIREYKLDGAVILQHLRDICEHPHPDTGVIKIVFDGCTNIARHIREELSRDLSVPGGPVGGSRSTQNGVSDTGLTSER